MKERRMSTYSSIHSQRSMFFDEIRNAYYHDAIRDAVTPESIVLDLGAGLGGLGMMAVAAGAKKVYMVEPTDVVEITKIIIEENQLSDRVECIKGTIEEVDLPEQVDIVISVFTGNFLLSEDLLPSLFYARDKYLRPGGIMIPDRAKMIVAPVSVSEFYQKHIDCWSSKIDGVNYKRVRNFAVNSIYPYRQKEKGNILQLSDPAVLMELDFMESDEASCRNASIEVQIQQDGTLHGCIGWFDAKLGRQWLSTSPVASQMHWSQIFLPLNQPLSVKKGQKLKLTLDRPEFGEWSWIVHTESMKEKHSTFLSVPISLDKFMKKSGNYRPKISREGAIAKEVLMLMRGDITSDQIISKIHQEFFPLKLRRVTESIVKNIIGQFS